MSSEFPTTTTKEYYEAGGCSFARYVSGPVELRNPFSSLFVDLLLPYHSRRLSDSEVKGLYQVLSGVLGINDYHFTNGPPQETEHHQIRRWGSENFRLYGVHEECGYQITGRFFESHLVIRNLAQLRELRNMLSQAIVLEEERVSKL